MTDRCERCKRGYSGGVPRDDIEWLDSGTRLGSTDVRRLRVARCTRCNALLADLSSTDRERSVAETHDVCVVQHDQARAALLSREPSAVAAISPQLRRRHLEDLAAELGRGDRETLERIERGEIVATEAFRGLATRFAALTSDLPAINPMRVRARSGRGAAATGVRVPLDLGDGSCALLEPVHGGLTLTQLRGDAVVFRTEIRTQSRDGFLARVTGRAETEFAVLVNAAPGDPHASLYLVDGIDGTLRGPGAYELRPTGFEARALPAGCTFLTSYQTCAIVRPDATIVWKGSAPGFPTAVPREGGIVVVDAPWRLVALSLPDGGEQWAIPVDRGAQLAPSGDGHLLLSTTDVVARLDVRGAFPQLVWLVSGTCALSLAGGGAALVREHGGKSGRSIECVVVDAEGRRRFSIPRPETTKNPTAEIAPGVLLFHNGSDVAVGVHGEVTYALSLPGGAAVSVSVDHDGAWIEYDGIIDRIDRLGQRSGRWRSS